MDNVAEHWRKTVNAQQEEINRLRKDLRKALEKIDQLEQQNRAAYGPTAGLTIERQGDEIKRLRTELEQINKPHFCDAEPYVCSECASHNQRLGLTGLGLPKA